MINRNSNIELLRIVSMLIIVMHHFAVHSQFPVDTNIIDFNRLFVQFMTLGGKIGVDCFVLISGYFLVKKEFSLLKLLKLVGQIWFYAVCIAGIAIYNSVSVDLLKNFVPIYSVNWFAYVYMILYVFSPFINRMLLSLDKQLYIKMLLTMTILWVIFNWGCDAPMQYSNIVWFVYMYAVGAYFRLYNVPKFNYVKVMFICIILMMLAALCIDLLEMTFPDHYKQLDFYWKRVYSQNSPLVIAVSVSMFLYFKNLNINQISSINTIAATTFGIYLLHDNPLVRAYIWPKLFVNAPLINNSWLFIYAFAEVFLVFTICSIIDYIRSQLLGKTLAKLTSPSIISLEKKLNNKINKIIQ